MGYANPGQVAGGVHTRQYARTFLIADGSSRVVFVNIDACMGSTLLKLEVLIFSHIGILFVFIEN